MSGRTTKITLSNNSVSVFLLLFQIFALFLCKQNFNVQISKVPELKQKNNITFNTLFYFRYIIVVTVAYYIIIYINCYTYKLIFQQLICFF